MTKMVITLPEGAVAIVMSMSVCVSVCLSARMSLEPRMQALTNFLCMLRMSVAWSSFGMLMIGHITYWREGVKGVHSVGEV